jgi:uncharacterized protein YndB with AHSA1/START domain
MPTGKTKDAGWQIGVSRTVDAPVEEVWKLVSSDRGTRVWLGPGADLPRRPGEAYETADGTRGELRSRREHDRIRLTWHPQDWDHDTTVQVALEPKGARTVIRLHQERLADAQERDRQRAHWRQVADELEAALGDGAEG